MKENEFQILEQYDIDLKSTRKIRGAVLCDTNKGPFLLKEMNFSERRLPELHKLYCHIQEQGYNNVDMIIKNKEGELSTTSQEGVKYILKKWFYGKECDNKKEQDILDGVRNLALLHRIMKSPKEEQIEKIVAIRLKENNPCNGFAKHNRELKKVRTFIRGRVTKGDFEQVFLQNFDKMYSWADSAATRLEDPIYDTLLIESVQEGALIHGDYNYHNVLILPKGVATANFEHFRMGIQMSDYYYFLRKTMEKNQWDIHLGDKMIECYNKIQPLTETQMSYLALCIAYPEKFWKVANSYYRSRKAWISAKSLEKLEMAIKQTEEKQKFLATIFSFYL